MGFLTTTIDRYVSDNIMEDITMPAIVKFPSVVEEALDRLGDIFPNEPERRHFAEYLTGLMIAHKKNVSAINREFASTTDQSCLNQTHWDIIRVLKVYRCRWTGTECFHRDDKQSRWISGGDCQLRNGRGQTRHMYLVFLAHSVLMRQLRQGRAYAWARERLTTIGQACMTVLRQTLSDTIEWVFERIEEDHWDVNRIKFQLALP